MLESVVTVIKSDVYRSDVFALHNDKRIAIVHILFAVVFEYVNISV